jgi:hypothetical protein
LKERQGKERSTKSASGSTGAFLKLRADLSITLVTVVKMPDLSARSHQG